MMRVAVLGSGSRGNALAVEAEGAAVGDHDRHGGVSPGWKIQVPE